MGRPKGSIALKNGDSWSKKWPGLIALSDGKLRKPIVWKGRCTNIYFVESNCTFCDVQMLRRVKGHNSRFRPICSAVCKSKLFARDTCGNTTLKVIGPEQGAYVLVRDRAHPRASNGQVRQHIVVAEKKDRPSNSSRRTRTSYRFREIK